MHHLALLRETLIQEKARRPPSSSTTTVFLLPLLLFASPTLHCRTHTGADARKPTSKEEGNARNERAYGTCQFKSPPQGVMCVPGRTIPTVPAAGTHMFNESIPLSDQLLPSEPIPTLLRHATIRSPLIFAQQQYGCKMSRGQQSSPILNLYTPPVLLYPASPSTNT